MEFEQVDFNRGAIRPAEIEGKVRYLCRRCKREITPNDIRLSLLAGRWETGRWTQDFEWEHHGKEVDFNRPPGGAETLGAHMSLLYSLQARNLEFIAKEWVKDHGTEMGLNQFENEYLGIPVRFAGVRHLEEHSLAAFAASASVPTGIVPSDAVDLFCGVDSEHRGFQVIVIGIGPGVIYVIDRFNLFGPDYSPYNPESWARLGYRLLGDRVGSGYWLGEDGGKSRLFATFVDFMGDANRMEGLPWMVNALRFCEDGRAGGVLPNGEYSQHFTAGAIPTRHNIFAVRGHSNQRIASRANWPAKPGRQPLPGPDGRPDPNRGFDMYWLDVSMIKHDIFNLYAQKQEGELSGFRMELPSDIAERFPKFYTEMGNERWVESHGKAGGKWDRTGEQASLDCLVYALGGAFYGAGGIEVRKTWDASRWASRRAELAAEAAGAGGVVNAPPPPPNSGGGGGRRAFPAA